MTLKKKYFVWKCVREKPYFIMHPNTYLAKKEKWANKITIIEHPYIKNDWGLAHIEWDNSVVSSSQLLEHAEDFKNYKVKQKTPGEVIDYLNEMFPPFEEYGEKYFSLDQDGFTIIDKRPLEVNL